MIDFSKYTIEEHLHRYACWTAARAASTSRFSNDEVGAFIHGCNLRKNLEELSKLHVVNHEIYRDWFIKQVNSLHECLADYKNPKNADIHRVKEFGIAAKIVSIYIKTVEVLPSSGTSAVSIVAFPPVDSFLLKKLVGETGVEISNTAWSQMNENDFMEIIDKLKLIMGDEPFWKLEYFWNINSKADVAASNL